jgi:RecB family exonuclease
MPLKVTPARVNAWQDCPRRYLLAYIICERRRGGPWAHLEIGNAVHRALAGWTALPPHDRTDDTMTSLLDHEWPIDGGFRDPTHSTNWLHHATGWVHRYAPSWRDVTIVGSERTVSCRYNDVTLEGRVDRIDDRDGQLVIVDYKTGRHPSTDDDAAASWALALYSLATGRILRRRCARAELHHLPTGLVAAVDYTRELILRQIDRLTGLAREIDKTANTYRDVIKDGASSEQAAILFPTRVGPLCGSCPYRHACPDGQAIPAAAPWSYLDRSASCPA